MEFLPVVCLCLLSCTGTTSADGNGVDSVTVEEGSDAVLLCSTTENIETKTFHWKKDGLDVFFYQNRRHYNNDKETGQYKQFEGRVFHFDDKLKDGNASIKITKTQLADSGNYSCTFPPSRIPSRRVTLFVDRDPTLRDKTGEEPGAAPKPFISTLAETKDWALLQCEAHGSPPPSLQWQDSSGNNLTAEEPQSSDRGGRSYVTVKITVTKTDNYSCVAVQETIRHKIAAVTFLRLDDPTPPESGTNIWLIVALVVSILIIVLGGLYIRHILKQNREKDEQLRRSQSQPSPSTPLTNGST